MQVARRDRLTEAKASYAACGPPFTPLRRVGTPAEVAAAVVWLAGPQSAFVSGQTLLVDGGVFSRAPWPDY